MKIGCASWVGSTSQMDEIQAEVVGEKLKAICLKKKNWWWGSSS